VASWCSPRSRQDPELEQFSPQQALRAGRGCGIAAGHGFFDGGEPTPEEMGIFYTCSERRCGRGEGAVSQQINLSNPQFLEKKKYISPRWR